MKVIYTEEIEKEGNDCLIKDLYSIIEVFSKYEAIHITRYVGGWVPDKPEMRFAWFDTEEEAQKEIKRMKRYE